MPLIGGKSAKLMTNTQLHIPGGNHLPGFLFLSLLRISASCTTSCICLYANVRHNFAGSTAAFGCPHVMSRRLNTGYICTTWSQRTRRFRWIDNGCEPSRPVLQLLSILVILLVQINLWAVIRIANTHDSNSDFRMQLS